MRHDRAMTKGSLRARLLVATPTLDGSFFERTVIIMLDHGDDGALGLIVNRPDDIDLADALPAWAERACPPAAVFVGGPMQPNGAIGLGRLALGPAGAPSGAAAGAPAEPTPNGFAAVGFFGLGTVDLERGPDQLPAITEVRLFAGHSGWGPGQLEAEIAEGSWWVLDSIADDPFSPDPTTLWHTVLARQPGRVRLYARFPDDPSAN